MDFWFCRLTCSNISTWEGSVTTGSITDCQLDGINTLCGISVDYLGHSTRGVEPGAIAETPVSLVNTGAC